MGKRTSNTEGGWVVRAELLLFLPFLVHAALVASAGLTDEFGTFHPFDWGVVAMTMVYLGAAIPALSRPTYARRFAGISGCLLVTVLVCEVLIRALYPIPPARIPYRPMTNRAMAGDGRPGIEGVIELTTNDLGLIGNDLGREELESSELRILCVGGSTTECRDVTDGKRWPCRLRDKLDDRLGTRVFVGNAGRAGEALARAHLLRSYTLTKEFDRVVFQVGCNDLHSHLEGAYRRTIETYVTPRRMLVDRYGTASIATYFRGSGLYRLARHLTRFEDVEYSPWGGSPLEEDFAGQQSLYERERRVRALEQRILEEPPEEFDRFVSQYRRDLQSLIGACRELRLKMVFTTTPHLYHAGMPSESARLLNSGVAGGSGEGGADSVRGAYSPACLEEMISAFNRATIDVCREERVDCIDLASMLPRDTSVFYDDYHFNVTGCDRVAEILADHFASRLRGTPSKPGRAHEPLSNAGQTTESSR